MIRTFTSATLAGRVFGDGNARTFARGPRLKAVCWGRKSSCAALALIHIDHTRAIRRGQVGDWVVPLSFRMCYLRLDRTGSDGPKRFRFPFAIPIPVRDAFGNEHRAEPVLIAWVSTRRSSLGTLMSMPASSSSEASDESINHPGAHPESLFPLFSSP